MGFQIPSDTKRSAKEAHILDCALTLLIRTGDAGLTLRKLADSAGMRLSNVQYYFKSRDDVLVAMIEKYFEDCTADLVQLTEENGTLSSRERLHFLIRTGLAHGVEISDMCRAFREIWAISSRNELVDASMTRYYVGFAEVIADFALASEADTSTRQRLQTLLIPFFEGYSITAHALPLQPDAVADMLTDIAISMNEHSNSWEERGDACAARNTSPS